MINWQAISATSLESKPFHWAHVREMLKAEDAARLGGAFPNVDFESFSGYDGEKNFELLGRPLVVLGTDRIIPDIEPSDLWDELVNDLLSDRYRDSIANLSGCHLDDSKLEVNLWRWPAGYWIGPHTDLSDKYCTQIIYLNDHWDPSWGGQLKMLLSPDMDDAFASVTPSLGDSALVVRSESSWHAVAPVAASAPDRLTIQVIFHDGVVGRSQWANRSHILERASNGS